MRPCSLMTTHWRTLVQINHNKRDKMGVGIVPVCAAGNDPCELHYFVDFVCLYVVFFFLLLTGFVLLYPEKNKEKETLERLRI